MADAERIEVHRVGEGFGLESVTARVDVTWSRASEPTSRTETFAVKLCSADNARGEQHAYEVVLAPTTVRHPVFVAAYDDGEHGVVVTQFVHGAQGDVLAGCAPQVALDIVDSVASLHAAWLGDDRLDLPALGASPRSPFTDDHIDIVLSAHADVLPPAARVAIRSLPGRIDDLIEELLEHPSTVVHGDLHLDNVMIDENGAATILDWGRPRRAPGAVDLARCFVEVVDGRPDDPLGRALIERYTRRLESFGIGDDPAGLRRAIDLAQLVFVVGVVRWGAANPPEPGTRSWCLFRNALGRLGHQLDRTPGG